MSKQHLLLIKLKTSFPLLYASTSLDIKTLAIASNNNFEGCLSICCLASQQILYFFFIFAPGFSFAFGNFARYCVILLSAPLSGGEKKMSAMGYFLWEILIHCHWCQEVLSSHWLVSWCGARCQFTNHCELKSSIWFWEEYIHFEWIYKVFRFDPFSSNFGITLQGCWQTKVCWEILMFEIFVPWHPFIQHASRLF